MEKPTKGIRRVLVVAGVALLAFAGAVVALADDARKGCVTDAPQDPSYQVQLLSPMQMVKTEYEVVVTRNGQPVTGAKVCARVFMVGMEAMGSSDAAGEEIGNGVYKLTISFVMEGGWEGAILISEERQPRVSVPLEFEVE